MVQDTNRRRSAGVQKGRSQETLSPITPHITIALGGEAQIYFAFVTTAGAASDAPSTITLHAATVADVAALAANFAVFDADRAQHSARLVLVEATELTWQRARYREAGHGLAAAHPTLLALGALRQWLWQRFAVPIAQPSRETR
jgi:hypothetical protein